MFDAPLPTPAIVIHVTPYVAGAAAGTNHQTHVTLKPEIDANEKPHFSVHSVFHEIAHYYLYARPSWFAEGSAEFAASYARHSINGAPIELTNSPCSVATSLSELEARLPDDVRDAGMGVGPDLWQCNYALGERLILNLYHQLGEEQFLQGWRELYGVLSESPVYPSPASLCGNGAAGCLAARRRPAQSAESGTRLGPVVSRNGRLRRRWRTRCVAG